MRNQIKFTFQIGYAAPHAKFEACIAQAASVICGGCTTSHKTGHWMSDGDSHAKRFNGSLEREHCFQLELTCESDKAEAAYQEMVFEIAALADALRVETDWVHVSEVAMTGRHFSVAAINAAKVAA